MTIAHIERPQTPVWVEDHFRDDRGLIRNLITEPIYHIALFTSKWPAVRGNHVHHNEGHYTYLISGRATYHVRYLDKDEAYTLAANYLVYTPAGVPHAFRFLEESMMLSFSTQPRTDGRYEADTVKVELIPMLSVEEAGQ